MLDWLIVGGGIHGTHLSRALVGAGRIAKDRVRVIDPEDAPAAAFFRFTAATGMTYLRSPGVHNLDLDPFALRKFAKRAPGKSIARFVPPYDRPGLAFFRAHVAHVVKQHGLAELRIRGRALALERVENGFRVETERGSLESRRVVLAIGMGEQPCWPAWATPLTPTGHVSHVFGSDFDRRALAGLRRIVVVGGGITAGQLAGTLAAGGADVTLLTRHTLRIHRFDSDPKWLGPRGMTSFDEIGSHDERRAMIVAARHRGSMPPEIAGKIASGVENRTLRIETRPVLGVEVVADAVRIETGVGAFIEADHVVLATGFAPHCPGSKLVADGIERLGLACARCGFPIVRRSLEWTPGLFVSGPLAELELGPTARNIAGARAAAERLLACA